MQFFYSNTYQIPIVSKLIVTSVQLKKKNVYVYYMSTSNQP